MSIRYLGIPWTDRGAEVLRYVGAVLFLVPAQMSRELWQWPPRPTPLEVLGIIAGIVLVFLSFRIQSRIKKETWRRRAKELQDARARNEKISSWKDGHESSAHALPVLHAFRFFDDVVWNYRAWKFMQALFQRQEPRDPVTVETISTIVHQLPSVSWEAGYQTFILLERDGWFESDETDEVEEGLAFFVAEEFFDELHERHYPMPSETTRTPRPVLAEPATAS